MDQAAAQAWLDRYVAAWLTYDPVEIGALFSEDVTYRYSAYSEPTMGRAAVVSSWLGESGDGSSRDAEGTYTGAYAPVAIDGQVVVAIGTSTYLKEPGGAVDREYANCFVIRFDPDGLCRDFTEYYMRRP